jgi:hypothetical protein
VKVFHVTQGNDAAYAFQEIHSVSTDMKPVTLLGDVLALADSRSQTALWNWKDGTYSILRHFTEESAYIQVRCRTLTNQLIAREFIKPSA